MNTKEEQMRAEFWKRYPMQHARINDATYDSTQIMQKLFEFERGWQAALNSLSAKSVPENVIDSLDFERLRSGQYRALNPENQPIFDKYFSAPQPPQVTPEGYVSHDAYRGAMDRAYLAERELKKAEDTITKLCKAFNAENGPTHMGEPVLLEQIAQPPEDRVREVWIKFEDSLPPLNTVVFLKDENTWMNTGNDEFSVNWHGAGYLSDFGGAYWSVFDRPRGMTLESVTHWKLADSKPLANVVQELEEILNWIDELPVPTAEATFRGKQLAKAIAAMKEPNTLEGWGMMITDFIEPNSVNWSAYDAKRFWWNTCPAVVNGALQTVIMTLCEDEVVFTDLVTKKEVHVEKLMNVNNRFKPLDSITIMKANQ